MPRALTLALRTSLAVCALIATTMPLLAQGVIRATTEDGRKVLLSPDGSWRFVSGSGSSERPAAATQRVDLLKGKMALYLSPEKWRATKSNDPTRLTFQHTSGDGYAMVLAERMEMPLKTLKGVALNNAKEAAPDAHLVSEEERTVNGLKILCMQIEGTLPVSGSDSGVMFIYYGYYYAGPEGVVQVITYTSRNLFSEYKPEFEAFLNGFGRVTP